MEYYDNLNDEELVDCYRNGDENVMEFVLAKYKPLVRKKAKALYLIGGETDDLIQEGMIGLFKAIQEFSIDKESSFFYFADLCITRQMYTAVESSQRKKHGPLNSYISIYEKSSDEGNSLFESIAAPIHQNPEELLIRKEYLDQRITGLKKELSQMEGIVFEYILEGYDYQQIAKKLNKPPKAIDNTLQRIKSKIARSS